VVAIKVWIEIGQSNVKMGDLPFSIFWWMTTLKTFSKQRHTSIRACCCTGQYSISVWQGKFSHFSTNVGPK